MRPIPIGYCLSLIVMNGVLAVGNAAYILFGDVGPSAMSALAAILIVTGVAVFAERFFAPGAGAIGPALCLGAAPSAFMMARWEVARPVIRTWSFRTSSDAEDLGMFLLFLFGVGCATALAVVCVRRRPPSFVLAARAVAAFGLLFAGCVAAAGLAYAIARPTIDGYIAGLPAVERMTSLPHSVSVKSLLPRSSRANDLVIVREQKDGIFRCSVRRGDAIGKLDGVDPWAAYDVRYDRARDLYVLAEVDDRSFSRHFNDVAFRGSPPFEQLDVSLQTARAYTRPGTGWLVPPLVGLLLGAGAFVLALRTRSRATCLATSGIPAIHEGGGYVVTESPALRVDVPSMRRLPAGPVTLDAHWKDPSGGYRSAAQAELLVRRGYAGTPTDVASDGTARAAALFVLAAAATIVPSTALLAWLLC